MIRELGSLCAGYPDPRPPVDDDGGAGLGKQRLRRLSSDLGPAGEDMEAEALEYAAAEEAAGRLLWGHGYSWMLPGETSEEQRRQADEP